MRHALISTAVVAAVATLGDWIWAAFLSQHLMAAGLMHGALLCLAMGAMIGRPVARAGAGALAGIGIGIAAAALFYALAPLIGMGAMFPAWFALWVMLALLYHWLANATSASLAITRGIIAGVGSGLAFYLVSGMWTRWDPHTINYADHFARWAFAFAPGFAAIQGGRATAPRVL
jgi:hypothetical protein